MNKWSRPRSKPPEPSPARDTARAIQSQCGACGLCQRVSLLAAARVLGAGAALWDRHPRRQKVGCVGNVTYLGQPPGTVMFWPLTAEERFRRDGL